MAEYIEREALEKWLLTETASLDGEEDRQYVVERLRNELPAADVRPVVRGKWKINAYKTYYDVSCSVCGINVVFPFYKNDSILCANYCPNCGADMGGEDDESP